MTGRLSATVTNCTLSGVVAGDSLTVSCTGGTAVVRDGECGSGKPVTVSGLGLTGAAAGNYTLPRRRRRRGRSRAASLTATVTVAPKTYDGTLSATLTNCTLSGVLAGDSLTVSCTGGTAVVRDGECGQREAGDGERAGADGRGGGELHAAADGGDDGDDHGGES
jgi:hypothetical protein